jgi:hypothetical protein
MASEQNDDCFWKPEALFILRKAAHEVLYVCDPAGAGYITADDLIAEAWIRSLRHGCEETLGKQLVWSKLHMYRAYKELRWEQVYTANRPKQCWPITELVDRKGKWVVKVLDLADVIINRCHNREWPAIFDKACGYTDEETGKREGVTAQAISCRRAKARKRFKAEVEFVIY